MSEPAHSAVRQSSTSAAVPLWLLHLLPLIQCTFRRVAAGESPLESFLRCLSSIPQTELREMCDGMAGDQIRGGGLLRLILCIGGRIFAGQDPISAIFACLAALPPPTPPTPPTPAPPTPAPPTSPFPPSPGGTDPVRATARYRANGVGCTATILADRPSASQHWILCAAHCVRGTSGRGTITLKDGQVIPWRLVRTDAAGDLALLVCDHPGPLPTARIAREEPAVGTAVWHMGYGIDRPGNREDGNVLRRADRNGQIAMRLSVSSGDSGSGIFRADDGAIISVVCCAGGGITYGGGVNAIHRLLTVALADEAPQGSDLAPYVACPKWHEHSDSQVSLHNN